MGNNSSVAVNARAVPQNEVSSSPTSQVSAFSRYSSVAVNARAVPQMESTQVSSHSRIRAVTASPRDNTHVSSPGNELSPAKKTKAQRVRYFDDLSPSTPVEVPVTPKCESERSTEESLPVETRMSGQNSRCDTGRGLSPDSVTTSDTAMPNIFSIEEETTANSDQSGDCNNTTVISNNTFLMFLLN